MRTRNDNIDFGFTPNNQKRVYSTNASRARDQHEKIMGTLEQIRVNNSAFQPLMIMKGVMLTIAAFVFIPIVVILFKWVLTNLFNVELSSVDQYGAYLLFVLVGYCVIWTINQLVSSRLVSFLIGLGLFILFVVAFAG